MDKLLAFGILGLATGAIYAIAASGLIVTYTTSGIFNISHGAIGMVTAFVYWQLRFDWGWPAPVALVLVLGVFCPVFGAAIERIALRGLRDSSEVTKVIITVGLMVGMIGAVNWIWPPGESRAGYRAFFEGNRVSIGGNNISWHALIALGSAVVVAIVLRFWLFRTRIGVAMRAVVDNRDLAELNGARPNWVSQVAWAASASLAGLAGLLLAGTQQLNVIPLTLLVVNAYAAAIFGRLRNLAATFVGAMVLGLGNSYLVGYGPQLNLDGEIGSFALSGLRLSVPMIALFVVLLALPRARLRGGRVMRRETTPEPSWMISLWGAAVGVALVVAVSGWLTRSNTLLVNDGLVFAIAALSLVPLTGYTGQISLAPLTFAALGAALMSKLPGGGNIGTLVATVLIVAAIGAVVALPALRLSGIYLALATGSFAVLMSYLVFNQGNWFPQANVDVPPLQLPGVDIGSPRAQFILLAVAFAVLGLGVVAVRKSGLGRRMVAMRDSEVALGTLGGSTRAIKLIAFVISAAIGSMSGALVGTRVQITDEYQFVGSLSVVLLAVVGGVGAVSGALLGGLMLGGNSILAKVLPSLNSVSGVLPGLLGTTMARSPDGISGELRTGFADAKRAWWPLAAGTAGLTVLWAVTQVDLIGRWNFVVGLVVWALCTVPAMPALVSPMITSTRRIAMAALLAVALGLAVGVPWGTALSITGHRVVVIIVFVAVLAIAARNLLVPVADEVTSPDRIGLDRRFTATDIDRADHALGVTFMPRSPATEAGLAAPFTAFPGHAGRGWPLRRWRSVARTSPAGAPHE